jgi:hypothetical protein
MRRIALLVCLAVGFMFSGYIHAGAGQSTNPAADDLSGYSSIAPPFITPARTSFVTREGDSFLLTLTATCLLSDESTTQFEVLSNSPDFVHVSSAYRNAVSENGYAEGLGVVEVSPQIGDAGRYSISIRVRSCSGKVERTITFKVRVKPALAN